MKIDKNDTAPVVIDPQNDVLGEDGLSWGLVGESVKENDTVANIERRFEAAKDQGFRVLSRPINFIRSTGPGSLAGSSRS